jgi:hypothetical protein
LSAPTVRVDFNAEGTKLFGDITTKNVGREIAIFLDGNLVSAPVVQEKITDGTAIISGNFTADAAKELVRRPQPGRFAGAYHPCLDTDRSVRRSATRRSMRASTRVLSGLLRSRSL